jgi:hypothetical protein
MRGSTAFRAAVAPGGVLAGPWVKNELWRRAKAVPSLDLRFADDKSLRDAASGQQLVTFTRASSGTFVGSDGLIKTATTNLLLRSEEFDDAFWTKTNATITTNNTASPAGTVTADKLVETSATGFHRFFNNTTNIAASTVYTLSVYAKASERNSLIVDFRDSLGVISAATFNLANGTFVSTTGTAHTITALPNGWYRLTVSATTSASHAGAGTYVFAMTDGTSPSYTGNGTSGLFLWGAQLEQSSTVGEYIPTTSTINSAPRFDHNPTTGESLGLLVEEQRTNLCLQSEVFATTWTTTSASVSSNTTVAPDGTTTGDTITASGSTVGRVQQNISFTGDGDKAISVWLKAGTSPTTVLKVDDSTAGFVNRLAVNITWTAGVATGSASNGTLQGIDAYPNGWYRIRGLAVGVVAANTNRYRIEPDSTNGTGSVIAWGAQAENGAFPTSYIPTTTATVTRSADVASITGNSFSSWYRQDEGTVFASSVAQTGGETYDIANNAATNRFYLRYLGAQHQLFAIDASVTQAQIYDATGAGITQAQSAGAYRTNDIAIRTNGGAAAGAIANDISATIPTMERLSLGSNALNTGAFLNGTIRRLTYWPRRLGNEVLQEVTR